MLVPIPQDWDGETWQCVELHWPDSDEWLGLLQGVLTLLTRGRYWDEKTGIITDTQEIAWEIFNRSYPFVGCDGDEIEKPPDDILACYAGIVMEAYEMGQVVTDVTLENGVLYKWFGPCCKIAISEISAWDAPTSPGTPDPEEGTAWACNKARGMADEFGSVLRQGVTELISVTPGLDIAASPYMQAWLTVLPHIPWDRDKLWSALVWYSLYESTIDSEVLAQNFEDYLACAWNNVLLNTSGLSETEYDAMVLTSENVPSFETGRFVALMIGAAQYPYFTWIAEQYHQETGDCTCPEESTYEGDFHWTGEFTADAPGEFSVSVSNNGKILDITWNAPSGAFVSEDNLFCTCYVDNPVSQLKFRVTPLDGSNMPTENWVAEANCPATDPQDWVTHRTNKRDQGTALKVSITGGYEVEEDYTATEEPTRSEYKPRKCGESTSTPAQTYKWRTEVIEVNGAAV